MQLRIEDELRRFVPIKNFREQFVLPVTFGLHMFDTKDFISLGQIESTGASELNVVRQAVLDAIPTVMPLEDWLAFLPHLARLFENKLHEINPGIGLKTVEIDYAVAGFTDVCQKLIYTIIRARAEQASPPDFRQVYDEWLSESVQIGSTVHSYIHNGDVWAVQIVHTAYGRIGLIVWMDNQTHYVLDNQFGCPAEGFMLSLLSEVATRIIIASDVNQAAEYIS
jgi:hypothetical protein